MLKYLILMVMLFGAGIALAQDSTQTSVDTIPPVIVEPEPLPREQVFSQMEVRSAYRFPDSVILKSSGMDADSLVFHRHPYFLFTDPVRYSITVRQWKGKETVFYSIIALLLFFALIRNGFSRYISDLFKIFFRTTVKQRQLREQLTQSPLPSLLLNIFFIISGGMFLALLLHYFELALDLDFWSLFFYCVAGLTAIYGIKFLTLKFLGWLFQVSDAIDAYIFIVFTTNKVIGMALVPLLVLLAFTAGMVNQSAMTLAIIIVVALFLYRYYLSYSSLHRQVHISLFHFILYLCAFEIAPLLLINKLLFRFLGETS